MDRGRCMGSFHWLTAHPMQYHYNADYIWRFAMSDRMDGSQGPWMVSEVIGMIVQPLKLSLDRLAPELCYSEIWICRVGRFQPFCYNKLRLDFVIFRAPGT